jgi:hypothetical protein
VDPWTGSVPNRDTGQTGRPLGTVGIVQQQEAWVMPRAERVMVQIFSYTDIDQARAAAERLTEESG